MTTSSLETIDRLERYLSGAPAQKSQAFDDLVAYLRAALADQRFADAIDLLRRIPATSLEYPAARKLARLYRQLRSRTAVPGKPMRLAVLGGFTTRQLTGLVELFAFQRGAGVEVYEADYGVFRQEILDPSSPLGRFAPDTICLATSWRDLSRRPELGDGRERVRNQCEQELADWLGLWQTAHDRLGCQVIQDNFTPPPWRPLGNHETRHPAGFTRFVADLNALMSERAPVHVTIHDVAHLAASAGYWEWSDGRYFHLAKMPCAPQFLVDYADSLAALVAARLGLYKKCLVLDLDNTVWGGVIGDDGLEGIRLGQGQPEGEAFVEFQSYLKQLRLRGVVLAVCSKNTEAVAREPFERHPEMALRMEDISSFVANWNDKPQNLRTIAQQLNLGLDSFVFVDDSPAERALVRRALPEVAVPELPADPAAYVRALERQRYFEVLSLAPEDLRRTDFYRANVARAQSQASYVDVDGFLRSLAMKARSAAIDRSSLERSVQLINRTNQFNLTTRRYSPARVAALIADEGWVTRSFWLRDRFGDNGLISVVLARVREAVLDVDTWVMSCRVFKRGMERFVLRELCRVAADRGCEAIRGEYMPSPKNSLVRDHYLRLGFEQIDRDDGRTRWELKLPTAGIEMDTFIEEEPFE